MRQMPNAERFLVTGALARFGMPADWSRLRAGAGVLLGLEGPGEE